MEFSNNSSEYLERYRREGDKILIEISINQPYDLYDDKDPSPLNVRDITPAVEQYIVDCVREIPSSLGIRIDFYFYTFTGDANDVDQLRKSVSDFFKYAAIVKKAEFKNKIMQGLKSLLMGLTFLFLCTYSSHAFVEYSDSLLKAFFIEGVTVLGWVSLWNPVQIFLYEIWPILSQVSILNRCTSIETTFRNVENLPEIRKYIY